MKQKPIRIRLPGEKLSPEELASLKRKQAKLEAEAKKPGFLGRREVVIGVMSLLGIVVLGWLLSWWLYAPFPTGSIEGVVTCESAPLPGGKITFIPDKPGRPPAWSMIDANGHFLVKGCPAGPCRIIVETFPPAIGGGAPPKDVAEIKKPGKEPPPTVGTYVKIAPEYSNPTQSPLTYTVTSGSQTYPVSVTK